MNKKQSQSGLSIAQVIVGIIAILMFAVILYGLSSQQSGVRTNANKPWNENMSMGSSKASNIFIDYTDYFCAYCSDLHKATGAQFKKDYIDTGLVRYENRVTTLLADVSENTARGAEAAYCAADQKKYWDYSDDIVKRITTDYFDKGIGRKDVANPKHIGELPISYFVTSAENTNMDTALFKDCVGNEKHKDEIAQNTQKAAKAGATGLPYIVVNDFTTSGFQGDYSTLKTLLEAGGVKR